MGELIRDLSTTDKLLCPNSSTFPIHEAHMLRNRVLDGFYDTAPKDADGEMPELLDRQYAAANERVSDWMELYVHAVSTRRGLVECWWWKCGTCGLIVPAARTGQ